MKFESAKKVNESWSYKFGFIVSILALKIPNHAAKANWVGFQKRIAIPHSYWTLFAGHESWLMYLCIQTAPDICSVYCRLTQKRKLKTVNKTFMHVTAGVDWIVLVSLPVILRQLFQQSVARKIFNWLLMQSVNLSFHFLGFLILCPVKITWASGPARRRGVSWIASHIYAQ